MKRQLELFINNEYDVLVIGGGINGLFIAWDAALRGLSVALIEKADFGGATSSNSLRIIHGGFRHLQNLDLRKTRRFMREQRIFMKMAPHLARPMPIIVPFYNSSSLKKKSIAAAIKIYDLLGMSLSELEVSSLGKFKNRIITSQECTEMIPNIKNHSLSYGIRFADCQLVNSERFSIQVASSASREGAHLANYVEALSFIVEDNRVKGAAVRDSLTGDEFEISAKITVDASGPWLNSLLSRMGYENSVSEDGISKAFNILIKRDLTNSYALGLHSQIKSRYQANLFSKQSRYLFVTPWKGQSLIGTQYLPSNTGPDNFKIADQELSNFLDEINECYPSASLKMDDVEFVYGGFVPTYLSKNGIERIGIKNHIYDHEKTKGLGGLLSARGSKYTEARIVAQETVDLVIRKIGATFRPSNTRLIEYDFGHFDDFESYINNEIGRNKDLLQPSLTEKLISAYGVSYQDIIRYIDNSKSGQLNHINKESLVKAQVLYAIREEMAQKLTDVIFSRIDLNMDEISSSLREYSKIMADELNWSESKRIKEEDEVKSRISNFNGRKIK